MRYLTLLIIALPLFFVPLLGQQPIGLSAAIARMDTTHPELKISTMQIEKQRSLLPSAVNLPNPQLMVQSPNGTQMRPSILWTTEFPGVYVMQNKVQGQQINITETERKMKLNDLTYELSAWYFEIQYLQNLIGILQKQDSAYARLVEINILRSDQITALEKVQSETQYYYHHSQLLQTQSRRTNAILLFNRMIGAPNDSAFVPQQGFSPILLAPSMQLDTLNLYENPSVLYYEQQVALAETQAKLERNRAMPGLMAGYFNQGPDNTATYYRLNFGITVPVFFWQYSSRIKASKQQVGIATQEVEANTFNLQLEYAQARQSLAQSQQMLDYYTQSGLLQSAEILRTSEQSYNIGSISLIEYSRSIDQVNMIETKYLESIFSYNKAALYIQFLNGFTE